MTRFVSHRWKIAVRLVPLVAVVAGAKTALNAIGVDGAAFSPLYTGLVAGTIFLLAFLLSGTLADYKESERLPGELSAALLSMADEARILLAAKGEQAAKDCLAHLGRLSTSIDSWLRSRDTTQSVLDQVTALNDYFLAFEPLTQPNFIVRMKQEQNVVRKTIIRIATIRDTSFVKAGYAIAELTSVILVVGLLFTEIGEIGMEVFLVSSLAFLLGYVLLLIRDLDNPFEYDGGKKAGAAEVSLAALDHAIDALRRQ
jgi:hypothetical protein